ncbi:MAG: hypothetical protein AAF211_03490 [Myxococcota bacterium]
MARNAIWVVASAGPDQWVGRLVPGPTNLIHVHFPHDTGPLHVPLGTRTTIGVATAGMSAPVCEEGVLVRVDQRREEALECVFEFDPPARLLEAVEGAVIDFREPRRHPRARVDPGEVVHVPITLPEIEASARHLVGRLVDGSAGGLGLLFPRVAEPILCRADYLRAVVPLPGMDTKGEWVCRFRYRFLVDERHVRYGAQFVSDGLAVDPPGPQLEALWDCQLCGAEALLAETHAHCPRCGAARHGHEREPSWRDLATAGGHRYGGYDIVCEACGVAHGHRSQYCSHCGTSMGEDEADIETARTTRSRTPA